MVPTPLAFLRGRQPPRTSSWHQHPLSFSDAKGRTFAVEFYTPTPPGTTFSKQVFPIRTEASYDELDNFNPPPHYHLLQDEYFFVKSGKGIWHLGAKQTLRLEAGDELMVPARTIHWFRNDPDSDKPLAVEYRFDREYVEMEERFFRNVFGYTKDCRKAGMELSTIQMMVFCMHNWLPLGIVTSGPQMFNLVVNTAIMLIIGCFGEFMMGYKSSYPEYYSTHPKTD